MSEQMVILQWSDVFIGLGLIAVAIGLSWFQGFGLERDLAIGTLRSIVQLAILGYVLVYLFELKNLWIVVAILLGMALIAAYTGRGRMKKPYPGMLPILWFSIACGSFFSVGYVTLISMRDPVALTPQYLIPLGGMIIGNSLNGITLGVERFHSELSLQRDRVECLLAMGANGDRASHDCLKAAFGAAMIPTINALMVLGLIQIPGIMTGQVMAGVSPVTAVMYQLVAMFMIAGGKVVVLTLGLRMGLRKYFTPEHQLRMDLV